MTAFVIIVIVALLIACIAYANHRSGVNDNWQNTEPTYSEEKIAGLNYYPGTFSFDIVGESHYQTELAQIAGGKKSKGADFETPALLVPYANEHDDQAVGVLMGESVLIGHLSRADARKLRIAMQNMGLGGCSLKVPAKIVGGWKTSTGNEGHFGVKLDLPV